MASIISFTGPAATASAASLAAAPAPGTKALSVTHKRFESRGAISASFVEGGASTGETIVPNRVKLAFSKFKAYRKGNTSFRPPALLNSQKPITEPDVEAQESAISETDVPVAVKLAMEKAKEYKKNKQVSIEQPQYSGEELSFRNSRKSQVESNLKRTVELKISSKDFMGLDFLEKKSYGRKILGLVAPVGPLLEGDGPEAEIIVGDASKFERTPQASTTSEVVNNTGLYKPKISTWGVFPRPNNISKTFGGGRVIEAGEMLETPEAKLAKEMRSRELIFAYKKRMGLTVDAKTKAECEEALNEGDSLMDLGELRGALPYYEKVMKNMIFQSELHGRAALQWSICQDSLSRPNEARVMYQKLQSHPNAQVSKKARQFESSFQAMEKMKVKGTDPPRKTGYEDYFDAFVDRKESYTPIDTQDENLLEQAFPYILFLLFPILIIFFVAVNFLLL